MNIQVIAEHSVDLDLLKENGNILDAGCRGFSFTNHMRSLGHKVIALDLDDFYNEFYYKLALVKDGGIGIAVPVKRTNDPQAMHVAYGCDTKEWVQSTSMHELYLKHGYFDLAKFDIEGSEYEVITAMDVAYMKQLSVEFHTHCGQTDKQVQECVDKLHSLGYKTIQHEKTRRHGLAPNYWDSLFILCD